MKSAVVLVSAVLLLVSFGHAEDRGGEGTPKMFLGLIQKGQVLNVVADNAGFRLVIGAKQSSDDDVEVRRSRAARDVAKLDLDAANAANLKQPGAVSTLEMQRYWLQMREAMDAATIAQNRSRRAWKVIFVGADYIGLQDGTEEMFIPLTSIKALTRDATKAASNASVSE